MNIDSLFPSKFLKASDLEDSQKALTISGISIEDLQDGSRKPALSFKETDKQLILNKVNATTISSSYGKNTDQWAGKRVILFSVPVSFQNKLVDAIRIKIPVVKPVEPAAAGDADFDDDIPI